MGTSKNKTKRAICRQGLAFLCSLSHWIAAWNRLFCSLLPFQTTSPQTLLPTQNGEAGKYSRLWIACVQALRGAMAEGREKEGELATTSLVFEYLHGKSRCEMLIGGDDINNDVITLGTCFQCLFTFALVSASRSLNFIRLLRIVFSSQHRLNRPVVNAVHWRHYYPKTG